MKVFIYLFCSSKQLNRVFDTVKMGSKVPQGNISGGSGGTAGGGGIGGPFTSLGYGSSPFHTPTRQGSCIMSSQMHMTDSRGGYNFNTGYSSYAFGSHGSSVYTGSSGHPSLDSGADSDASMHTDSEDNYP